MVYDRMKELREVITPRTPQPFVNRRHNSHNAKFRPQSSAFKGNPENNLGMADNVLDARLKGPFSLTRFLWKTTSY